MVRIGIRELRQHASRYVARVKAGEVIEVTERGTLVALLVPPTPSANARDRLIASGRLVPAIQPFLDTRARAAAGDGGSASAALEDLRGERFP